MEQRIKDLIKYLDLDEIKYVYDGAVRYIYKTIGETIRVRYHKYSCKYTTEIENCSSPEIKAAIDKFLATKKAPTVEVNFKELEKHMVTDKCSITFHDKDGIKCVLKKSSLGLYVIDNTNHEGESLEYYACPRLKLLVDGFIASAIINKAEPGGYIKNINLLLQKFKPIFAYADENYNVNRWYNKLGMYIKLDYNDEVKFANSSTEYKIDQYEYYKLSKRLINGIKRMSKTLRKYEKQQQKQYDRQQKINEQNRKANVAVVKILQQKPPVRYCPFCGKTKSECGC